MKNLTKNAVIVSLSVLAITVLVSTPAFAVLRTSSGGGDVVGTTSPTSTGSNTTSTPVLTNVCGDANNDGLPTQADYMSVRDYAKGLKSTLANMAQADINKNGAVTSEDADLLYAYLFLNGTCPGQLTSVCGDANNNGSPEITDHLTLRNNLRGDTNSFVINKAQADINQDGSLTDDDVTLLDNYVNKGGTCPAQMPVFTAPVLTSVCGDANNDGSPTVSDYLVLMDHLYDGQPAPVNAEQADINCDGILNVQDQILLHNYVFMGGTCPAMPAQPTALELSAYDAVACVDYNKDRFIDDSDVTRVIDAAFRGAAYESDLDWDKNGVISMVDVNHIQNFIRGTGFKPLCEEKEYVSCFDPDNDKDTDFNDMYLLNGIAHRGFPMPQDADHQDNFAIVDINMNGFVNTEDVVEGVNYLYRNGAKPECTPPQDMPYFPPDNDNPLSPSSGSNES